MILSQRAISISPSPTQALDTRAKQMIAEGKDVVNFGVGEPDFDTPEHICAAAIEAINSGFTRYTAASGIMPLKEAVCAKLKRDNNLSYSPEQIVISNGSKHCLANIFAAILNEGDEVIIPAPYWVSYTELVKMYGGIPVVVNTTAENSYKLNKSVLKGAVTPKTKALILNSPTNPTGQVYDRAALEDIAELAIQNQFFILSDEVYEKFIYAGEHVSIASLGDEIRDMTILINGASKTYAMTGWRIGYTASTVELAGIMASVQSHAASNPNSIAQKAALAALNGPQDCVTEMWRAFKERRNYMISRFDRFNLVSYLKPEGAFYLFVDVSAALKMKYKGEVIGNCSNFARHLIDDYMVAVVPGSGFGAPGFIRLSYATSLDTIKKGLDRIEKYLSEIGE